MRLNFAPQNEIMFEKQADQTMKGVINITNPSTDGIFAFKIKSTNPDLFQVFPLKGTIHGSQQKRIQFVTNDPVNMDFAKQLAQKHKFLIEYVPIPSQNSLANFKNNQAQKKKLYINMDSLRGASRLKDQDRMSMNSAISNKMSYISMKNNNANEKNGIESTGMKKNFNLSPNIPENKVHYEYERPQTVSAFKSENKLMIKQQDLQQKYSKLKEDLDDLNRERQDIMNKMSSNKRGSSIGLKKIALFILFVLLGTILGGTIKDQIQRSRQEQEKLKRQQEQQISGQGSWLDMFSFNLDLGLMEWLYDQVDPKQV